MKKTILLACAGLLFISLCASAQTAEEIIAKYQKKIFTSDRLKSLRVTSKISLGGSQMTMVTTETSDGRRRIVIGIQQLEIVQAWDGKEGWQINPMVGKDAVKMEDGDTESIKDSQFSDDFYDYKKKGKKIALEGTEEVNKIKCFKISLVDPNDKDNEKYICFFDATTYLPVMDISSEKDDLGVAHEADTYFNDYRDVGGYQLAFYQELKIGGETKSSITIDKAEINPVVEDTLFKLSK